MRQWQKRQGRHWRVIYIFICQSQGYKSMLPSVTVHIRAAPSCSFCSKTLDIEFMQTPGRRHGSSHEACSSNEKIQFRNPGYIQHLSSLPPSDVMCAGRCQLIPNFSQYLSLHRRTLPSKCQNKPTNSQFRVVEIICEDLKTQYIFSPSPILPGLAEVL